MQASAPGPVTIQVDDETQVSRLLQAPPEAPNLCSMQSAVDGLPESSKSRQLRYKTRQEWFLKLSGVPVRGGLNERTQ
jgi:hypothetical protein